VGLELSKEEENVATKSCRSSGPTREKNRQKLFFFFFLLRGDKTLRSSSVTVLFFVRRQQTVSCSLPRFDQRCLS
jgi:hypothetical protein